MCRRLGSWFVFVSEEQRVGSIVPAPTALHSAPPRHLGHTRGSEQSSAPPTASVENRVDNTQRFNHPGRFQA